MIDQKHQFHLNNIGQTGMAYHDRECPKRTSEEEDVTKQLTLVRMYCAIKSSSEYRKLPFRVFTLPWWQGFTSFTLASPGLLYGEVSVKPAKASHQGKEKTLKGS